MPWRQIWWKLEYLAERFVKENRCRRLNRSFPRYLLPLCQNESSSETIHMKMSLKMRQRATRKWPIPPLLTICISTENLRAACISDLQKLTKSGCNIAQSPYGIIREFTIYRAFSIKQSNLLPPVDNSAHQSSVQSLNYRHVPSENG